MHVSLDSALGRQRRLNSVGESITQIAPNPAAAYSLRSLTGGDPKVVRVRRDSDNDEQDFTASEVSSGALVDYVNTQVTKPLDVRELQSDGRTGDFVIAKAAYSLRSLGDRQATIAQGDVPLDEDTVQAPSGKYVVQVRRSSNNNIKSFTADEVTDGTLLDFVNEDVITEQSDFTSGTDGYDRDSHGSVSREAIFEGKSDVLNYTHTGGRFAFKNSGVSLDKTSSYTISFEYYADSVHNNKVWGVESAFANRTTASSNTPTVVSGAWTSATLNVPSGRATGIAHLVLRIQADASAVYGETGDSTVRLKNIVVTQTTGSGFVRALYDQSVSNQAGGLNSNHAIQSTAANQPKVVENGSLVSGGVLFTGASEGLQIASASTLGITGSTNRSIISVIKTTSGTDGFIPFGNDSSGGTSTAYRHRSSNTSGLSRVEIQGSGFEGADVSDGNTHLFSSILNGTQLQNVSIFVDGSETAGSGTATINTANNNFFIGSVTGSLSENTGTLAELIVYDTDQTDNRGAFEANIAEHYGISGVPAEDNQVNGFVETWYDQSGNSRDVTQTTADRQPKIVSSGALVTSNSLPSIDFTSNATRLTATDFLTGQLNSYFTVAQIEAGDSVDSQVTFRQGSGYRLSNEFRADGNIQAGIRDGGGDSSSASASGDLGNGTVRLVTTLITARSVNGITILVDGANSAFSDTTDIEDTNFSVADASSGKFGIGGVYNTDNFDNHGKGSEFIFYNTDQSANRVNIESNIANHYGITLS